MRLAKTHWERRPQSMSSLGHTEPRRIVRLVGGIVMGNEVREMTVREAWWVGGCRHVVLDVGTRRRVELCCPDCQPPGWFAQVAGER